MSLIQPNPALEPDDYEMVDTEGIWITVRDLRPSDLALSVHIHRTDEGVVVDLYPDPMPDGAEPLGSTYAFFNEAIIDPEGV